MRSIRGVGRTVALALLAGGAIVASQWSRSPRDPREPAESLWPKAMAGLASPDLITRRTAAKGLGAAALRGGFQGLTGTPDRVKSLGRDLGTLVSIAVRRGEDRLVRLYLIGVLRCGSLRALARDAARPLASVLEDEADDPSIRCQVAGVLAALGPGARYLPALEAATRSRSSELRQVVFRTLEDLEIDPSALLPLVARGLIDPSQPVRLATIDLVGDLARKGDPRAVEILSETFRHDGREQRMAVLEQIGTLGHPAPAVVADLAGAFSRERDPLVRVGTASCLLNLTGDSGRYLPALVQGLRSSNRRVWYTAAGTLSRSRFRTDAEGTDPRLPLLTAVLHDSDRDVRTRAAVVLAAITRRPEAYRSWLEEGLRSGDAETRSFAALGLRDRAGGASVFAIGWPSAETVRLLVAALLGLVVYVGWEMRRVTRGAVRKARSKSKRLVVLTIPRRIVLRRRDDLAWSDPAAMRRQVAALQSLGFRDAGAFAIEQNPSARLWCLVKPEECAIARVVDHDQHGIILSLSTEYHDGSSYLLTTQQWAFRPVEQPGRQIVILDGSTEAATLYQRLLAERPAGPMRAIAVEAFAAYYEQAHADHADWRNSQGGMLVDEIQAMNRAQGIDLDDRAIDAVRAVLQKRALHALDLSLRERFLDRAGLSGEERERISSRLVIVHDGLPLAGLDDEDGDPLPARQAFEIYNQGLGEPERYLRIGAIDRPVAADVYLGPEPRANS